MGYLYEAMENAKETTKARLKSRLSQFLPYTQGIEQRWSNQLRSPLHAARCILNQGIFFMPSFSKQREVTRGFLTIVTSLIHDFDVQEQISEQLKSYNRTSHAFRDRKFRSLKRVFRSLTIFCDRLETEIPAVSKTLVTKLI